MHGNEFGRDGILSKLFLVTHGNSNVRYIASKMFPWKSSIFEYNNDMIKHF